MQKYKTINAQDYINASRTTINENFETVQTNNSGTAFPTSNLFEGMKCYRTDLKKTYTLKDVTNRTWVNDGDAETVAWGDVTDKSNATTSAAGLMSAADKTKLDGIAAQANKYSLPTASSSTLGGVKIGSNIGILSGVISVAGMTAATASAAGKTGLVPAPAAGNQGKFLRGDGTWQTPTNTTYSNFVKSGSSAAAGLVPKPSTTAGTTHYLREDGTWSVPPNTTYSNFVKSGSSAAAGLVPKPSTTAGTTKYLREDGTWQVPPDNNTTYSNMTGATSSAAGTHGLVPAPAAGKQASYLRGDGAWAVPTNTTYSTGTTSTSGLTKLYTSLGDNADGTCTQKYLKSIIGSGGGIIAASIAANGYVKFANGFILQWKEGTCSSDGISFPIAFPNNCYAVLATRKGSSDSDVLQPHVTSISTTKALIKVGGAGVPNNYSTTANAYIIAVGK